MKSFLPFLALFLASALPAWSQQTPVRRTTLGASPVVVEGKVTFRLLAPQAKQVNLKIGGRKEAIAMERNERGLWTGTVEGLRPEIYEYQFEVDGLSMIDPGNAWVKSGLRPSWSVVEIPGTVAEFWEARDIPHGTVTIHAFWSKSLGAPRSFRVYAPPGYDSQANSGWPVLYLLHGSGDTDDGWTVVGRADLIADNLLAANQMKPMLIVMPNGTYSRDAGHENDFESDLLGTIVPMVEKHYRVADGGRNRALAGLSMGGFQTLSVGLRHMDQFASLGVFSAGVRENSDAAYAPFLDQAKDQLAIFWIGIGEDDFLRGDERKLVALLNDHRVKFTERVSAGGHTWDNWRHYLHEFLPLLFQAGSKP